MGTGAGESSLVNGTNSDGGFSTTFVATSAETHITLGPDSTTDDDDVRIQTLQLREVGVATGWTDADQQLDIAQPALQSYNEMLYSFDSTDGFTSVTDVVISDHNDIDVGTGSFSISLWFRTDSDNSSHAAILKKGGWNNPGYSMGMDSSQRLAINTSGSSANNNWAYTTTTIEKAKWYHVVGVWNRTTDLQYLYLNGILQTMAGNDDISANGNLDNSSNLSLYSGTGSTGHFAGCINEVAFFRNVKMGAANVLQLYNDGKALDATLCDDASYLKGYWRNNGLSTWTDLSTNSNDGAVTGSETLLIPQGVDGSRDAQGFIMNRARNTSSANMPSDESQIECGPFTDIIAQGASAASMECWMKADGTEGSDVYATFAGERTGKNILLCRNSGTSKAQAIYSTSTSGNNNGLVSTTADVFDNNWHHIAFTFGDGDGVGKLYVDGSHEDTATNTGETLSMDDATFFVGGGDNTATERAFNGTVDGVKVYSDTLSAAEVTRNYKATKGSHRN